MDSNLPTKALEDIVTDNHIDAQSGAGERYVPYSFALALRKSMAHLSEDDVQELKAGRSYNIERGKIQKLSNSSVSNIFDGELVNRKLFTVEFDRAEHGVFPWGEIRSNLGDGPIIYDIPIRRIVVRFNDEKFVSEWRSSIKSAIESDEMPTNWIEPPFFAVLESQDPGDGDARDNVRSAHEDFYFQPNFANDEDYEGMDWSIRTLDLKAVWSYQAFANTSSPVLVSRSGDRQYDWTPRRIEKYVMNFFKPEEEYTGLLRNSKFASLWRQIYSTNITAPKRFKWEEDEEWVQTG